MITHIAVKNEEDYTIIPVNIFVDGVKSHEIETGIRTLCEHIISDTNDNCNVCGEYVEMELEEC